MLRVESGLAPSPQDPSSSNPSQHFEAEDQELFYASFYRPFYALYERFYDFYDFYNFYDFAVTEDGHGPQQVLEEQPIMQVR